MANKVIAPARRSLKNEGGNNANIANNANARTFRRIIWKHYRAHGRNLPWRNTRNPYRILVSEIMLQQTQVSRVLLYYPTFLKRFPNFRALHRAPMREVLAMWQGLGYNRRALALKKTAEAVISRHGGKLPKDRDALLALPGIGQSTAGAVLAFAYHIPAPFIETNIRRVFIHHFFPRRKKVHDEEILKLVAATVSKINPREWYWALMDYGAYLAGTVENPNKRSAHYTRQSKFEGSNRQLRGKLLKFFAARQSATAGELRRAFPREPRLIRALRALIAEGFLRKISSLYELT